MYLGSHSVLTGSAVLRLVLYCTYLMQAAGRVAKDSGFFSKLCLLSASELETHCLCSEKPLLDTTA